MHDESLRILNPSPVEDPENWSVRRISAVARQFPDLVSYLEVGVEQGLTFQNVTLPMRIGVDPKPRFRLDRLPSSVDFFVGTSDAFFAQLDPAENYDVIFLDGLHTYQQTYRDLINALRHCPRGIVLIDDVVPCDEVSAIPDKEMSFAERGRRGLFGLPWHGDVFRMLLCLADHHPELDWVTIIEPDNPQTFVWKRHTHVSTRAVSDDALSAYGRYSYSDVFAHRTPDHFHPATEADGLAIATAGLRELRNQTRSLPQRVTARLQRDWRRRRWKHLRRRALDQTY